MENKDWSFRNFIRFIKANDYKTARDLLEERIKQDPNNLKTLEIASKCYLKLNLLNESLGYSKNILELYPNKSTGFVRTAEVFILMNQLDEALELIDEGLQKVKKGKLELLKVGSEISRKLGDRIKSLQYLKLISKKSPKEEDNFCNLIQDQLSLNTFNEKKMGFMKQIKKKLGYFILH